MLVGGSKQRVFEESLSFDAFYVLIGFAIPVFFETIAFKNEEVFPLLSFTYNNVPWFDGPYEKPFFVDFFDYANLVSLFYQFIGCQNDCLDGKRLSGFNKSIKVSTRCLTNLVDVVRHRVCFHKLEQIIVFREFFADSCLVLEHLDFEAIGDIDYLDFDSEEALAPDGGKYLAVLGLSHQLLEGVGPETELHQLLFLGH